MNKVNTYIVCDTIPLDGSCWAVIESYEEVIDKIARNNCIELHDALGRKMALYRPHIVAVADVYNDES